MHLRLFFFTLAWSAAVRVAATLTVATYNVENFVVADRMADGVYHAAYPKPESEKTALCRAIAGVAPDILAVEEMGPAPFLAEFQRELRAVGQDFAFTALLEAADPDRHVAVLSKVPLKDVRRHALLPTRNAGGRDVVKRGVLEVVVATSAGDCTIFVLHLKSRYTDRADDPESAQQRAAEAEAVRDLVLARQPDPRDAKFIVCGDWNDTRGSRPVRALTRRGATEIGEILPAIDSRGESWTHYYHKDDSYSRIDYVLVSAALKPFVTGNRAMIWDGPGATDASDHRAVYVQLMLDPAKR
jgi:endonuclease/exonuclease/phosphatase family metal-dependent hydrolase